jgi:hypothetical protein
MYIQLPVVWIVSPCGWVNSGTSARELFMKIFPPLGYSCRIAVLLCLCRGCHLLGLAFSALHLGIK